MRALIDPASGELVEVQETQIKGLDPYDYREAKAAHMRQSSEHRHALMQYDTRVKEKADREREYHKQLALAIVEAKAKHGSTVAEKIAKGTDPVLDAHHALTLAEGLVTSAKEYIEVCKGDRVGISQLTKASLGDQRWEPGS